MTTTTQTGTYTTIRRNGENVIVSATDWTEVAAMVINGQATIRPRNDGTVEFLLTDKTPRS